MSEYIERAALPDEFCRDNCKRTPMTKPISEYTLEEVQKTCGNQLSCDGCRFFHDKCRLSTSPTAWNLEEKIFSMAERERAEAIRTLFPNAVTLRNIGGTDDSFVDLAGYAACAGELAGREDCD